MRGVFRIVATLGMLAFVAFPTLTNAPTQNRALLSILELQPSATVIFGGDMLFDRTIRQVMEREGEDFIFSCVAPVLRDADLVVANLEGTITEYPSVSLGSKIGSPENFVFTFSTSTGKLLSLYNIRLVNLGNNHILDFGWEGVSSTLENLRAAGVGYFGDPIDKKVAREEIHGISLAFIGYNEFAPGGWRDSVSTTLDQLYTARLEGFVPIVYTHWGDEYVKSASPRVRELAHAFVDAGAGIVIGSHPHVVQEHEVYKGKHIYYSLGNFFFDQYRDESVRHGLLLRVVFNANGVGRLEEIPIDNQTDRRTCVL